jgi:2-dehydropantoate 2-reductase
MGSMAMRILVIGAGAVGGYFGGRLAEAGREVTFLVRAGRADEIRKQGLRIVSPHGDATTHPRIILAHEINGPYDLILLSVKAYGLADAMEDFAAAVGPATMILPVLNGMRHLERLGAKFGQQAVLGGVCFVSTDLGVDGEIVQLTETQKLVYGELEGGVSERIQTLDEAMQGANFQAQFSEHILQDMWEKWVLLASLGALTCLLRGNVGEIENVHGGAEIALGVLRECSDISTACGFAPNQARMLKTQKSFTTKGSTLTSSMYRDLMKGGHVELDQIIGDLLRRGQEHNVPTPLLQAACVNLSVYSARLG